MDLSGYGKTFEEARDELIGVVDMQISFAAQRDEIGLIYHPAEEKWFQIFDAVKA